MCHLQPAKKGRRAVVAQQAANKESTRESSLFKDETEETIDLFESRPYATAVCRII